MVGAKGPRCASLGARWDGLIRGLVEARLSLECGQGDHAGGRGAQYTVADRHRSGTGIAKALESASVMPPSGPMMIMIVPDSGSGTWAIGCAASSSSTRARSTRLVTSWAVEKYGSHGGTRSRRDCLAASRRWNANAAATRAPIPPADDRTGGLPGNDLVDAELGQHLDGQLGPIALGQRLHGAKTGRPDWDRCSCTSTTSPELSADTTSPRTPAPRPSPIMIISPGPIRRTTEACRPSSPSRVMERRQGRGFPRASSRKSGSVMTDRSCRIAAVS